MQISLIRPIYPKINKLNTLKQTQIQSNSKFELGNIQPHFLGIRIARSVCLIFEDDSIEKLDSYQAAAERLGVSNDVMYNYLRTNSKAKLNGAICTYSDIIEKKNDNGSTEYDNEAIEQLKIRAKIQRTSSPKTDKINAKYKKQIYMVSLDGSIKKFNSRAEASRETKIPTGGISNILNPEHPHTATRERKTFISVYDASIKDKNGDLILDENNEPILDEKVIFGIRKVLSKLPVPQIVSIDKDCNVKIFQSRAEVVEKENVCPSTLDWNIVCMARKIGDKTYAKLSDVILKDDDGFAVFDENGNYILDRAKIEALKDIAGL